MITTILAALPILLGSAAGYAYYYYVGCASGTCPLSSNAWIMTGYGALVGATFVPFSKLRKKQKGPQ